jgi:hypothetical protein
MTGTSSWNVQNTMCLYDMNRRSRACFWVCFALFTLTIRDLKFVDHPVHTRIKGLFWKGISPVEVLATSDIIGPSHLKLQELKQL